MTAAARAAAALEAAGRGRTALKAAAARLDRDPEARVCLAASARAAGVPLPPEADAWPAKRLLRHALDRARAAQVVSTPTARDEAFSCLGCGREVPPAGRTARDHCPFCLLSVHVDVVPGDRAATCGAALVPVGLEVRGAELVLRYRCAACGHVHRVRALQDGPVPDDPAALRALAARGPA